ncbi:lipoyl(octanoyl) transferase LipB [Alphaproteobacteria bacterium]|nr:lipoyl(octanoyl) transferase LipB [Alphaproteobacteria bacterium]
MALSAGSTDPAWIISDDLVTYTEALSFMEQRVVEIQSNTAPETLWLLEHSSLYTSGTSAKSHDLLDSNRFPVFKTGRGGQYTYHGPGQRIAYAMLDLNKRQRDIRCYVHALEDWLIRCLQHFNVKGERREGRVGIWVVTDNGEKKIAAIGVRVKKWVTMHGISLNVEPDLSHFDGIVPCGLGDFGVTSLLDLGITASISDVDLALQQSFHEVFG